MKRKMWTLYILVFYMLLTYRSLNIIMWLLALMLALTGIGACFKHYSLSLWPYHWIAECRTGQGLLQTQSGLPDKRDGEDTTTVAGEVQNETR